MSQCFLVLRLIVPAGLNSRNAGLTNKKRVPVLQRDFFVDIIQRHQQGVSLSESSTKVTLTSKKIFNDGISKDVAAQLSGCSKVKVQLSNSKKNTKKLIRAA